MIHIQEQEHNISDEVIQGDTGNKPSDDLQQTGIFQGEGLILPDITGNPPAEEQRRIAGNGSDPEKDQPGPVPGGEFRELGMKGLADVGQDTEINDKTADADTDDNGFQPEGKLFLVHTGYLQGLVSWVSYNGIGCKSIIIYCNTIKISEIRKNGGNNPRRPAQSAVRSNISRRGI